MYIVFMSLDPEKIAEGLERFRGFRRKIQKNY